MQTISILQGDIDSLENERINLEKKLEQSSARKGPLADMKHASKIRTLGGPGSPYGGSPSTSPFAGRKSVGGAKGVAASAASEVIGGGESGEVGMAQGVESHPLLLSRVCQSLDIIHGCITMFFICSA